MTGTAVAAASLRTEAEDDAAGAVERGRWLFAQECVFVNGSMGLETIPDSALDEIAFAGRSNVGKSSLVNALTGRKDLARASNTPGRTRQLNFFVLGGRLMLADLPGYGYADAPKSEIERWTRLVEDYLVGRSTLRRVCLLIDARHGLKPNDGPAMRLLDRAAVSYQVVLTKSDKLKPAELERVRQTVGAVLATHRAAHPEIVAVSAHSGAGIPELRARLAALAADGPLG